MRQHLKRQDNKRDLGVTRIILVSNTRRWTRKREFLDAAEYPEFCVAAGIRQNGDVKRFIHRCSQRLPGLCIEVGKTASDTPSKMSSTLSPVNTFSRRLDKTSTFLRSNTLQGITISTYSASQKSTFLSQLGSTSPALKETTGRSKMVPETTSPSQDIQENTFPVLVESPSSDVPGKDEIDVVSEIVIIVIVAATILIVIVISVTVVFCKR
ncbi:unnamed protein product [Mytilus coruscus]|uniref:Uncharacterized protein n=1 Tax=Mytilus coruscus TaxID=42192 RepID=A0A6J8EI76_MYTCO|nr:unnamed protein product [Mytilus coruscus]